MTNFWVKSVLFLVFLDKKNFFTCSKIILFTIAYYWATKNGRNRRTTKKFPPNLLVLLLDPGFGILYPGSGMDKNQDPG
jgi:hypothetical protein